MHLLARIEFARPQTDLQGKCTLFFLRGGNSQEIDLELRERVAESVHAYIKCSVTRGCRIEPEAQMKIQWGVRAVLGLVLVILALISLVIDVAGIVQVWVLREPMTRDAIITLDLLNSTLDTTSQGLGIAKGSLKSVTTTLGALQTTVQSAAVTIDNASSSVNSVSSVIGTNLSGTVTSALGTLDAVENTTRTIDEVLTGLASLPFLNVQYDPAKSLSASVSDLSDQLNKIPESLGTLEKNLSDSGSSLDKVSDDANALAVSLGTVEKEMAQLVAVIEQYETQVKAFQGTVRNLREHIVTIVWGIVLFASFVLFWIGVTMVQTLATGLRWMGIQPKWFDSPTQN